MKCITYSKYIRLKQSQVLRHKMVVSSYKSYYYYPH